MSLTDTQIEREESEALLNFLPANSLLKGKGKGVPVSHTSSSLSEEAVKEVSEPTSIPLPISIIPPELTTEQEKDNDPVIIDEERTKAARKANRAKTAADRAKTAQELSACSVDQFIVIDSDIDDDDDAAIANYHQSANRIRTPTPSPSQASLTPDPSRACSSFRGPQARFSGETQPELDTASQVTTQDMTDIGIQDTTQNATQNATASEDASYIPLTQNLSAPTSSSQTQFQQHSADPASCYGASQAALPDIVPGSSESVIEILDSQESQPQAQNPIVIDDSPDIPSARQSQVPIVIDSDDDDDDSVIVVSERLARKGAASSIFGPVKAEGPNETPWVDMKELWSG